MRAEMDMSQLLTELRQPFHPSHVTWKPGSVNKDQTKALALAYADLRAYQNRLDEVCGMDWSVTYTPWSDKIVCHLTIAGVTRSSTGEADSQSERSEIAGTSAEAQAFKRACAMFSLGRYLYQLPTVWVEYDGQSKSFSDRAKARLEGLVVQHYNRVMGAKAIVVEPTTETEPATGEAAAIPAATLDAFDALGQVLYGDQWESVSAHNVERITGGASRAVADLTLEQITKLIEGMTKLKNKRQALKSVTKQVAGALV